MKKNITPKFTFNLSENIKNITNGKYTNINVNDENGLIVEIQNGEYIPAERLSIGTIDQLYLSLRISMIEEISKEKMPIILDEAFAYFDDEDKTIRTNKCLQKVKCIETNEVFDSVIEATIKFGYKSHSTISNVLNGRTKTAYGYHWVRI